MKVFDASAILAFLHAEQGHERVARDLPSAVLSVVNLAEVLQKFVRHGKSMEGVAARLAGLGVTLDAPEESDALVVARLGAIKDFSLADRFCVAAGLRRALPVVTADREWASFDLPVALEFIR